MNQVNLSVPGIVLFVAAGAGNLHFQKIPAISLKFRHRFREVFLYLKFIMHSLDSRFDLK